MLVSFHISYFHQTILLTQQAPRYFLTDHKEHRLWLLKVLATQPKGSSQRCSCSQGFVAAAKIKALLLSSTIWTCHHKGLWLNRTDRLVFILGYLLTI